MPLVQIVLILIVVGIVLWLLFKFVPMDADVRQIIKVVVIVALVLWLLQVFGLLDLLNAVRVGK